MRVSEGMEQVWRDMDTAPGNETLRLHRLAVMPEQGRPGDIISLQTPLRVELEFWNLLASASLHPRIYLYNNQNILAFTSTPQMDPACDPLESPSRGLFKTVCHIPARLLNNGIYRVDLLLARLKSEGTFGLEEALKFEVIENEKRQMEFYGKIPGVFRPDLPWETTYLGQETPEP
jgi:lipopolysaccharide transport system ATP-binding protein